MVGPSEPVRTALSGGSAWGDAVETPTTMGGDIVQAAPRGPRTVRPRKVVGAPGPSHVKKSLSHAPFDRILVVSEDAFFIEDARDKVGAEGGQVIACLGPAASPCELDREPMCPLAAGCGFVLVDAPPSGAFRYHDRDLQAGTYAERLQRAHPDSYVILIAPNLAEVGRTGEVAPVTRRTDALNIITWILRSDAVGRAQTRSN